MPWGLLLALELEICSNTELLSPSFRTKSSNIRNYLHWWIHANSYHTVVSEMEHLFPLLTLRKYYDNKMSSLLESIDFYMMTTGSIFRPACLKFITLTKDWWVRLFFCCVLRNWNHKSFVPCEIQQEKLWEALLNCAAVAQTKREPRLNLQRCWFVGLSKSVVTAVKEPICPSKKHFKLEPVKPWSLLWGPRTQLACPIYYCCLNILKMILKVSQKHQSNNQYIFLLISCYSYFLVTLSF